MLFIYFCFIILFFFTLCILRLTFHSPYYDFSTFSFLPCCFHSFHLLKLLAVSFLLLPSFQNDFLYCCFFQWGGKAPEAREEQRCIWCEARLSLGLLAWSAFEGYIDIWWWWGSCDGVKDCLSRTRLGEKGNKGRYYQTFSALTTIISLGHKGDWLGSHECSHSWCRSLIKLPPGW